MMTSRISLAFVLIACTVYVSCKVSKPSFIECTSDLDCRPGHCCVLGPIRYSIPQCLPMLEEGSSCRPGDVLRLNTTTSYPDGTILELTNVNFIMCPCATGLTCDRHAGGICRDESQTNGLNHISGSDKKDH